MRSKKLAAGEIQKPQKDKRKGFSQLCLCGQIFKSENGFKMHIDQNPKTMNGRCIKRMMQKMGRYEESQFQMIEIQEVENLVPHILDEYENEFESVSVSNGLQIHNF